MRRALCVGIDEYSFAPLLGCAADAQKMAEVLRRHEDGAPNFECRTLLAPPGEKMAGIGRAQLREQIELLFRDPAEVALFYFSGHGTSDNLDGYLVTQDARRYDDGMPMGAVLKIANDSKVDEVLILLDCCHAGQLGNIPAVDNTKAFLREGISIVTSSRGDQPSVEVAGGGLFTSLVVDALRGGAADLLGHVSAPSVYSYVEAALGAWDQRPLFKSHVTRVFPIRRCTPPIEPDILRRLPNLFPLPAEDRVLDPNYEPTSNKPDPEKVEAFSALQKLNRVRLVTPVDVEHMYEAAMQSRSCRLTPTGLFYWRLAKSGRI